MNIREFFKTKIPSTPIMQNNVSSIPYITTCCMEDVTVISNISEYSDPKVGNVYDIISNIRKDLYKLNMDVLKDKCKEIGITGTSKLNKPDLIQLLENEFLKISKYLHTKNKDELKIIGKSYNIQKLYTSKKSDIIYNILSYHLTNMLFKIIENTDSISTESYSLDKTNQQLHKPEKQNKREEETRQRIIEEETRQRIIEEETRKRIIKEEKKESKQKKQSIPKSVKTAIWDKYIGEDIIKHKCLCCKKCTITNTNFEVGHVISEKDGGTHEIDNLRPICSPCNHAMGTENMVDFVKHFGYYIG